MRCVLIMRRAHSFVETQLQPDSHRARVRREREAVLIALHISHHLRHLAQQQQQHTIAAKPNASSVTHIRTHEARRFVRVGYVLWLCVVCFAAKTQLSSLPRFSPSSTFECKHDQSRGRPSG